MSVRARISSWHIYQHL